MSAMLKSFCAFFDDLRKVTRAVLVLSMLFGIGLIQTVNAKAADAKAIDATVDPFSVNAVLGNDLSLRVDPDYSKLPKETKLLPLPMYAENDVFSYKLPALDTVKRPPADKKDNLTPEEQRFCLLVRSHYVEDPSALLPACATFTDFMREELVKQAPYITIIRALNISRFIHNLDLSWSEYEHINSVHSIVKSANDYWENMKVLLKDNTSDSLNVEQGMQCLDLAYIHRVYLDLTALGYPMIKTNAMAQVFNAYCSGKSVQLHDLMKASRASFDRIDTWNRISPYVSVSILENVSNWDPKTYLPPKSGTDKEQKPEIQEAQKLLKQLGFYKGKVNGVIDEATTEAVKQFEFNLGLKETGRLTYTNLVRMRLYTVGFSISKK